MKNKFLKIALYSSIALGVFSSCEKELDQLAFDRVAAETAFKTEANFTQAISGAYAAIKGGGYFSVDTGNQLGVPDLVTDNLILNPQGRQSNFSAYVWNFTPNNGSVTGLYTQGYFVISRANLPLKYIDNLPDGPFKSNIVAQARAIRAMVHFDLVKAYSKIPTQSADAKTSLGIAYVDKYDPLTNEFTRSLTVDQVYQKIIADLLFAKDNITETATGRLNKASILGLLSRVYLYYGDYDKVIEYGNLAIAASPSVGSITGFTSIWQGTGNDGVLFKVLNSAQENVTTGVVFQQGATATGGSIRSEYVAPKSFFDLYTANDIRKTAYFRVSSYQGNMRNHVIKYAFNNVTPLNVAEIKYLRTAEVYLNVAEAAYKKGNETLANSLLNTLKAQRYTGYTNTTLSGTALWDEIMLQRRLELAFENDRFYTFKRLGLTMQRTGEGANVDGTGVPSTVQQILPSDYRWQWPIPLNAININSAIQQNPGY